MSSVTPNLSYTQPELHTTKVARNQANLKPVLLIVVTLTPTKYELIDV